MSIATRKTSAATPADLGPVWNFGASAEAGRVRLEIRSDGLIFFASLTAAQADSLAQELSRAGKASQKGGTA